MALPALLLVACVAEAPGDGTSEPPGPTTPALAQDANSRTFEVAIEGQRLLLALRRIAPPVTRTYGVYRVGPDGRVVRGSGTPPTCLFEGSVHDADGKALEGAYAAVSTCLHTEGHPEDETLHGVIAALGRLWTIAPAPGVGAGGARGVWHRLIPTDVLRAAREAFEDPPFEHVLVAPRRDVILEPRSIPKDGHTEVKTIEVFAVNDTNRVAQLIDMDVAEADTVATIAEADAIFVGSGLAPPTRVVLVGQLSFRTEPYAVSDPSRPDSAELLGAFHAWATTANFPHHDLHLLYSGYRFEGSAVGRAALSSMCSASSGAALVRNVSDLFSVAAEITVHELGHTLGMAHDGAGNDCFAADFLMRPGLAGALADPQFSPCSQDAFTAFLSSPERTCLDDLPDIEPHCGDGIVEGDETCDCAAGDCSEIDPCCDGSTCQLVAGAECSGYRDGCCVECKVAAAGFVCRPARNECDQDELCTGFDSRCPGDTWPRAGGACSDPEGGIGSCYRSRCISRDERCRELGPEYGITFTEACPGQSCGAPVCRRESDLACLTLGAFAFETGTSCGADQACASGSCVELSTLDECPRDDEKLWPDACGCGVPDDDTDDDGVLDCFDGCPTDPAKTEPGECGCGVSESDPSCGSAATDGGLSMDAGGGGGGGIVEDGGPVDSGMPGADAGHVPGGGGGCAIGAAPSRGDEVFGWLALLALSLRVRWRVRRRAPH